MTVNNVIPKRELHAQVKRFLGDPKRGIGISMFAELCGISKKSLVDVFMDDSYPMTEYVQIRVSKGFLRWLHGEVTVLQNWDRTRFIKHHREPKPVYVKKTGLQVINGEIKLKIGLQNRADYSTPTLDEQLKRG